jgi:hypothetical protein
LFPACMVSMLYLSASVSCLYGFYAVPVCLCFLPAWSPCCFSLLQFPACTACSVC